MCHSSRLRVYTCHLPACCSVIIRILPFSSRVLTRTTFLCALSPFDPQRFTSTSLTPGWLPTSTYGSSAEQSALFFKHYAARHLTPSRRTAPAPSATVCTLAPTLSNRLTNLSPLACKHTFHLLPTLPVSRPAAVYLFYHESMSCLPSLP